MRANGSASHQVKPSSVWEPEAGRGKQLLENQIRECVRRSYHGRAGEEWLQACLRIVRNDVQMENAGKSRNSDTHLVSSRAFSSRGGAILSKVG
jgi:hypothetical protein